MITTRRHYRFRSREEAEAHGQAIEHKAHLLYRGLRALERGEIAWTQRLGRYQVGVFDGDGPTGARCLIRFWGNTEIETDAHDLETWAAQWDRAWSDEERTLRQLAEFARSLAFEQERASR